MSSAFHRLVKWWPVATSTGIAAVLTGWALADHAARRTAIPTIPTASAIAQAAPPLATSPVAVETNVAFRLAAVLLATPHAFVEEAAMPRVANEVAAMPRAFVEVAEMPRAFVEVAEMPRAFVEVAVMPRVVNEVAAMPRALAEVAAMPREVPAAPTQFDLLTQRAAEAVGVMASLVLFTPEAEPVAAPLKLAELTTASLSKLTLDYLDDSNRKKGVNDKFVTDTGLDFSEKGFALDAAKNTVTFKVKEPADKAAFKASLTLLMVEVLVQKATLKKEDVEAWVAKLELVFDKAIGGGGDMPPPPPGDIIPCPPVIGLPCPLVFGVPCPPVPDCAPISTPLAACPAPVAAPVCAPAACGTAPANCGLIRRLLGRCR